MIKFDKNEFLKPQLYSTLDEYETRCNVTKEIIKEIEQLQQQCKNQKEVIDKTVLELVSIDGNLSNSQLSDRICNLIDILKEVL